MDKQEYIYEEEALKRLGLLDDSCCTSCHEDSYIGYDLSEIRMPDGSLARVCCGVARKISMHLYGDESKWIEVD